MSDLGTGLMVAWAALMIAEATFVLRGYWPWSATLRGPRNLILGAALLSFAASALLAGDWPGVATRGTLAAVVLWDWWHTRRKRKDRAPLALGAKGKALRDALVRKAREAAKPRPVLRPAPGGAR